VRLDADGDGRYTPPRGYADRLVRRAGVDAAALLASLREYDEAVATQAAALFQERGGNLRSPTVLRLLGSAAPATRRGVERYVSDVR
jgi:hypothetical protein